MILSTYENSSSFDDTTASRNWHLPLRPAKSGGEKVRFNEGSRAVKYVLDIPFGIISSSPIRILTAAVCFSVSGGFFVRIRRLDRLILRWGTSHQIFIWYFWNLIRINAWFSLGLANFLIVFNFALLVVITFTAATAATVRTACTANRISRLIFSLPKRIPILTQTSSSVSFVSSFSSSSFLFPHHVKTQHLNRLSCYSLSSSCVSLFSLQSNNSREN